MNRIRIVTLVLILVLLVLPAQATDARQSERLVWASFYGGGVHATWDRGLVDDYNAQHPELEVLYRGVGVYSQPVPLRSLDALVTEANPPDVFSGPMSGGALHNYIDQGYIADISDLWEEMGWYDVYPQSVIDMASHNGKQYFVPQAFQWNPIFYRADIFEELDLTPPETWDDLLAMCDTISAAGYIPFTVSVAGWNPPAARWFTMLNLRLNGGEFHERLMAGQESFLDPRVRTVFEHWQQVFEHNCFAEDVHNTNYNIAVQELVDGEAVMYLLGEWLYEALEEEDAAKLDFFRFPVIDPEVPNAELVHFYGAYMHADAANPAAAREFLAYLGGPEVQLSIVQEQNRASASNQIDREAMPLYQQRGVDFIAESRFMTPLIEVSLFRHGIANRALRQLSLYYETWHEPDRIDTILNVLEETRLAELEAME